MKNDYSFPAACTIRFKFAAKGTRSAVDLFWYDGSIRPPTPPELEAEQKEFEPEGMLFVGDRGKILAGFHGDSPRLIPEQKMRDYRMAKNLPEGAVRQPGRNQREAPWVEAFRGGKPTFGDFLLAGPISDAFNLAAVSLRLGGRRLHFDAARAEVTNVAEANRLLTREYRKGWELALSGA